MALTFTESLMEAKRRAQLQGRPISPQETAGVVEGWAAGASDRNARSKALSLSAEQLAMQKQQNADQMRLAEEAGGRADINQGISTVGNAALLYGTGKQMGLWGGGAKPPGQPTTTGPGGGSPYNAGAAGAAGAAGMEAMGAGLTAAQTTGTLTPVAGTGYGITSSGAVVSMPTAGAAGAGGSTVAGMSPYAGAGYIAALIAAGMKTKSLMAKYARGGEDERGGVTGYLANASQTPVNSVLSPGQAFVDAGVIGEDTAVGKIVGLPGKAERWVMDPIGKAVGCGIIMTAIHGADSPEVDLCRRYRDRILTDEQLRGYYVFAEPVCFIMEKHPQLKGCFRRYLTESFVDYAQYRLKERVSRPSLRSVLISRLFLRLCSFLGRKVPVYKRLNGEVY